jgi:hypothetical protein
MTIFALFHKKSPARSSGKHKNKEFRGGKQAQFLYIFHNDSADKAQEAAIRACLKKELQQDKGSILQ